MIRIPVGLILALLLSRVEKAAVQDPGLGGASIRVSATLTGAGDLPSFVVTLVATERDAWPPLMVWPAAPDKLLYPPPGEYRIAVTGMPAGYSVKALSSGDVNLLTDSVRIERDQTYTFRLSLEFSRNPIPVPVSGHVVDRTARGAKPLRITLKPTLGGLKTVTALVESDGAFEFPKVLPGSYEVRFDPSFDSADRLLGVDGKGLSNLKIRAFIPTFRVTGTFQDIAELQKKSEIVPHGTLGPSVRLVHQNQEELLYRNLVRIVRGKNVMATPIGYIEPVAEIMQTKVSSKGSFEFKNVPAGLYQVRTSFVPTERSPGEDFSRSESLESSTPITVADRDVTLANIQLKFPEIPNIGTRSFVMPNRIEIAVREFNRVAGAFESAVTSKRDLRRPIRDLDQASDPLLDYLKSILKSKRADPEEFKELSQEQLAGKLLSTTQRVVSCLKDLGPAFRDDQSVSVDNLERFRELQAELLRLQWLASKLTQREIVIRPR